MGSYSNTATLFTSQDPEKVQAILDFDSKGVGILLSKLSIEGVAHKDEKEELSLTTISSKFPSFSKNSDLGDKQGDEEGRQNEKLQSSLLLAKQYKTKAQEIVSELQKQLQGYTDEQPGMTKEGIILLIQNTIEKLNTYIENTGNYIETATPLLQQQEFQQFQEHILSTLQHSNAA